MLSLPSRPAVILLHAYAWLKADPAQGTFYNTAERDFNELAEYYSLPAVSVKGCCYAAMRANEPGFQVGWCRWVEGRARESAGVVAGWACST